MAKRDTQLIELAGRHRLIADLVTAKLEVAVPVRDRGVDLVAYVDLSEYHTRFLARPIQVKASSLTGFGINRKYEKISDLIIAFVWYLDEPDKTTVYALTYPEAVAIGDTKGWTKTPSWLDHGSYTNTSPGKEIREMLEPHRMTPDKWWAKITCRKVRR